MADNALGGFLRARREAIAPSEVGLPAGTRRRTPGLRRAELAALAGISVEYLTRLERGRDRSPSGQVLGTLADALGLSPDERVHLHRLVKTGSGEACVQSDSPARSVRAGVRALLDRLEPAPALVVDAAGDVLACTHGFRLLATPVGLLDADQPNLARFVFTDAHARAAFPDWDRVADERCAALRAASAVLPAWTGVERWEHPAAGALRLAYESLPLPGTDEHRLIVYLPGDADTSDALAALAAHQPDTLDLITS